MTMTVEPSYPCFLTAGDTALVVEFGAEVSRAISDRVLALAKTMDAGNIPGIVELVPTFRSLMVHYDPLVTDKLRLETAIRPLFAHAGARSDRTARLFTLPVSYGAEHGPDLDEVAARTGLTTAEVVREHTSPTYHVYAIGFLPGYPYMGDGPEKLSLPRRETPRLRVPMGTVCIAFRQVGLYSLESPGGWHLLGRTPVRLFDLRREPVVLLSPGDKVRFAPISTRDFDLLSDDADAGRLKIPVEGLSS